MNKYKLIALALLSSLLFGIIIPTLGTVKVAANEIARSSQYDLISEDSTHRKIRAYSPEFKRYVTYTYYKASGVLEIDKGTTKESIDVVSLGEELSISNKDSLSRASNSSIFSKWSYSSSGNRYTLRVTHASYGAKTKTKTVTRNRRNAGYIDNFVRDINNLRIAEQKLIATAGSKIAFAVLGAIASGGIAAIGAITSAWAVMQVARDIPPIYDRALFNFRRA